MKILILLLLVTVSFAQVNHSHDCVKECAQVIIIPEEEPHPFMVTCHIYETYPEYAEKLIKLIGIESSWRPHVDNPFSNATGYCQILPICARDCGWSYELVKEYWYINIHVGYLYFKRCLEKSNSEFDEAYAYYYWGLYHKSKG